MNPFAMLILSLSVAIFWLIKWNGSVLDSILAMGSVVFLIMFCLEYDKRIKNIKIIKAKRQEIEELEQLAEEIEQEQMSEPIVGKAMKLRDDVLMVRERVIDLGVECRMLNGEGR